MFTIEVNEVFVKDYIDSDFIQLKPKSTVREALSTFLVKKQDVGCVVSNNKLVGVITKSILYRSILNNHQLSDTMEEIMKTDVVTVRSNDSMFLAKEILSNKKVGHAVVLNEKEEVHGVLTTPHLINGFLNAYQNISTHLQTLIENLDEGIISVDVSFHISGYNQSAVNIYPQLQQDHMKAPVEVIDETFRTYLQQAMKQRTIVDGVVLHIDNKKFIGSFIPLFELNQLIGAMVILRDITSFESIAKELASTKKLERMLDSAIELSFDAVAILDTDGRLVRANKGFQNLYNLFNEETEYKTFEQIAPEIAALLNNGKPTQLIKINDVMCLVSFKELKDEETYGTLITIMYEQLNVWKNVLDQLETLEHSIPFVRETFEELDKTSSPFHPIISKSSQMMQLKKEALIASNSHLPIFITGDNGTGKSLLAKCIHEASKRTGNFITVNCAAIPEDLLEAEFFGYVDGAFTGAKRGGKPGKFELADEGTIFLDEIGDMPLSLQAKLLRVIQEKEVERLGDTKSRKLDVRIITATNKNIDELVKKKLFREDLYYRIHVIHLHMPPLHGRHEDIVLLSEQFLQKITERDQKNILGFTSEALQALVHYHWPGNIRQLENVIERSSHFCDEQFIHMKHLPREISDQFHAVPSEGPRDQPLTPNPSFTIKDHQDQFERKLILDTLQSCNGNKSKAAKQLGISRTALYNKLKQLNIETRAFYTPTES